MHGVTLAFQAISLMFAVVAAYFIHKLFSKGGKLYGGNKETELQVMNGQTNGLDKDDI